MPTMAIPHLTALLLQLRRALAGDVLAYRFPSVVTGEHDAEERVPDRSTDRAARRYIIDDRFRTGR